MARTRVATRDLERDLERHALVLAESLERSAEPLLNIRATRELQRLVDRFQNREQLAGVALYDSNGLAVAISLGLEPRLVNTPRSFERALVERAIQGGDSGRLESGELSGNRMYALAIPVRRESELLGALAVFHDAAGIDRQTAAMWRDALGGAVVQTLAIVCVTLLTIRASVSRPLQRMAHWTRDLRTGAATAAPRLAPHKEFEPLTREVARMASSLTAARAAAEEEARLRNSADSHWTPERLRVFVRSRLAGRRLFVVSNREPYEHFYRGTSVEWKVPASGLVTAIEPILLACDGTWVAHATGEADRDTVDEFDRVRVPPDHPQFTLRRVWLGPEEEEGFYSGFANEGLWPLCHLAHTRPTFRQEDWEYYRAVNCKFAAALLEEMRDEPEATVLVQDYHFALLPRLIKRERPDARVAIFWHIPWPNPEAFGICPWQRDLIDGLLGADLIGFHIQAHCNNFLDTVDRALESRIDRERFDISYNERTTRVRPFPISVALNGTKDDDAGEMPHLERAALLARHGVRASFMGVGVDRVDYTKGIPERFRAIERFLERCPAYRREFTFVQIGAPSRTQIRSYL
ncbi:MAG: alpha,alpha-trehalose-phosphate synthase (UDP-forming), partial [Bryobacteraceae bacterium]